MYCNYGHPEMVRNKFHSSKEYGISPTNTVTSLFSVYFKGDIGLYDIYLILWAEDYVRPLVLHIDRPFPKHTTCNGQTLKLHHINVCWYILLWGLQLVTLNHSYLCWTQTAPDWHLEDHTASIDINCLQSASIAHKEVDLNNQHRSGGDPTTALLDSPCSPTSLHITTQKPPPDTEFLSPH